MRWALSDGRGEIWPRDMRQAPAQPWIAGTVGNLFQASNYREAYFQAVSNSSWAHEGYLVAVQILQDDEFSAELKGLASPFGIGIIQLDPTESPIHPVCSTGMTGEHDRTRGRN